MQKKSQGGEKNSTLNNDIKVNIIENDKEKLSIECNPDEKIKVKCNEIRKLKKGEYIKITSVVQFGDFLTVGYDDGLILVYQIEKQQMDKKKPSIGGLQEKI